MAVIQLTLADLPTHVWASGQEIEITDPSSTVHNFAQTQGSEKIQVDDVNNVSITCQASPPPTVESYIDLKVETVAGAWREVNPTDPTLDQPGSNLWYLDWTDGVLISASLRVNYCMAVPDTDLDLLSTIFTDDLIPYYYASKVPPFGPTGEEYCRRRYVRNGEAYQDAGLDGGAASSVPQQRGQWSSGAWNSSTQTGLFLYCEGNPISGSYYGKIAVGVMSIFRFRGSSNITFTNFNYSHAYRLFEVENLTASTTISGFEFANITARNHARVGQIQGGSVAAGDKAYVDQVNIHDLDVEWGGGQALDITGWLKDVDLHDIDVRRSGMGQGGTGLVYCGDTARPAGYKMRTWNCTTYLHGYGANDNPKDGPSLLYHDYTPGDPDDSGDPYYQHGLYSECWDCAVTGTLDAIHSNSGQRYLTAWNIECYDIAGSVMNVSDSSNAEKGGEYYSEHCTAIKATGDRWTRAVKGALRGAFNVAQGYDEGPFTVTNCAVVDLDGDVDHIAFSDQSQSTTDPTTSLLVLQDCYCNSLFAQLYVNNGGVEFSPATGLTVEDDLKLVSNTDVRLQITSPLRGAGAIVLTRSTDAASALVNTPPDVGAYQYIYNVRQKNARSGRTPAGVFSNYQGSSR